MSSPLVTEAPAELVDAAEIPLPAATDNPPTNEQSEQKISIPFPAYYDSGRKSFWVENARGGWIEFNEKSLQRLLKKHGYSASNKKVTISQIDKKLSEIQLQQDLDYAGPLAGHMKGIVEMYGQRLARVTNAPKLIVPKEGKFPTVQALIDNLFVDPQCDQRPYLFGWLKVALESLYAGHHRPGQALAIAGPRDSGKSLFQNIITEIFGGRAAKPYRYMSGGTEFNGELFGCEHQMIEDDIGAKDFRARQNFGTRIKEFTVNEAQSCHPKKYQAITLRPWWRLSITVNEEPENLMILPPLDDSIQDKIILLRAQKRPMPMPTASPEERKIFRETLTSELPAFTWYLLHWEIPEKLQSGRFGVTHFHHPELLAAIDGLTPENRLFELLKLHFKVSDGTTTDQTEWTGTAEELENELCATKSPVEYAARKLLTWAGATGTYLGRLAQKLPGIFEGQRTADKRSWRIKLPLSE